MKTFGIVLFCIGIIGFIFAGIIFGASLGHDESWIVLASIIALASFIYAVGDVVLYRAARRQAKKQKNQNP